LLNENLNLNLNDEDYFDKAKRIYDFKSKDSNIYEKTANLIHLEELNKGLIKRFILLNENNNNKQYEIYQNVIKIFSKFSNNLENSLRMQNSINNYFKNIYNILIKELDDFFI